MHLPLFLSFFLQNILTNDPLLLLFFLGSSCTNDAEPEPYFICWQMTSGLSQKRPPLFSFFCLSNGHLAFSFPLNPKSPFLSLQNKCTKGQKHQKTFFFSCLFQVAFFLVIGLVFGSSRPSGRTSPLPRTRWATKGRVSKGTGKNTCWKSKSLSFLSYSKSVLSTAQQCKVGERESREFIQRQLAEKKKAAGKPSFPWLISLGLGGETFLASLSLMEKDGVGGEEDEEGLKRIKFGNDAVKWLMMMTATHREKKNQTQKPKNLSLSFQDDEKEEEEPTFNFWSWTMTTDVTDWRRETFFFFILTLSFFPLLLLQPILENFFP